MLKKVPAAADKHTFPRAFGCVCSLSRRRPQEQMQLVQHAAAHTDAPPGPDALS